MVSMSGWVAGTAGAASGARGGCGTTAGVVVATLAAGAAGGAGGGFELEQAASSTVGTSMRIGWRRAVMARGSTMVSPRIVAPPVAARAPTPGCDRAAQRRDSRALRADRPRHS